MTDEQNDFPQAWRPDQDDGPTISGAVVSVSLSPDFGYGPYPIVTLNTADGERAVHAMHHVLRTELARRRPKRGDELEITYLGKRSPKSGNGNPFHVYRVTGGNEPEFNWDSELPPEERRADVPIALAPVPTMAATSTAEPAGAQFDDDLPF